MNTIKKWWISALGALAIISSFIDWPALAQWLAQHSKGARFVAGLVWIAAHIAKSPLKSQS